MLALIQSSRSLSKMHFKKGVEHDRAMLIDGLRKDLDVIVNDAANAGAARWGAALQRVSAMCATNENDLHPRLHHLLKQRSYAKALDFLDRDA